MAAKYWLLKAEPDSRIVKGKDVKFGVDDFERIKTSPWEGVRNYEARNLMKDMKVGEKALFYHSNCKTPGIAGFAEVSKEAYPDFTAWDSSHPYYDAKSDESNPKWFMVDLTFTSRAQHFVPLALLRLIADGSYIPEEITYIGEEGVKAIKSMDLVTRGRLSVQRVDEKAWNTIQLLAEKGGWEELDIKPKKGRNAATKDKLAAAAEKKAPRKAKKTQKQEEEDDDIDSEEEGYAEGPEEKPKSSKAKAKPKPKPKPATASSRKRKAAEEDGTVPEPLRRSTRARK